MSFHAAAEKKYFPVRLMALRSEGKKLCQKIQNILTHISVYCNNNNNGNPKLIMTSFFNCLLDVFHSFENNKYSSERDKTIYFCLSKNSFLLGNNKNTPISINS